MTSLRESDHQMIAYGFGIQVIVVDSADDTTLLHEPAITPSRASSAALRIIGPMGSSVAANSTAPKRLTRPHLRLSCFDGRQFFRLNEFSNFQQFQIVQLFLSHGVGNRRWQKKGHLSPSLAEPAWRKKMIVLSNKTRR